MNLTGLKFWRANTWLKHEQRIHCFFRGSCWRWTWNKCSIIFHSFYIHHIWNGILYCHLYYIHYQGKLQTISHHIIYWYLKWRVMLSMGIRWWMKKRKLGMSAICQRGTKHYCLGRWLHFLWLCETITKAPFLYFQERQTNSKHIQFVSGVHAFNYWFSTFTWDFINYMIPVIVMIIIIAAFNIDAYAHDTNLLWVYSKFSNKGVIPYKGTRYFLHLMGFLTCLAISQPKMVR